MAGRRTASAEERALWRAAMHGVAPLAGRVALSAPDEKAAPAASPPSVAAPVARRSPEPRPILAASGASGLDRRTAERLRRGELAIAARLDLHGMTQKEAHAALSDFLARAQEAGRRCVLVITGKGGRGGSDGVESAGVLRAAVPRWLNEAPNRARLLAFASARPRDGGGGALYLLLRRRERTRPGG